MNTKTSGIFDRYLTFGMYNEHKERRGPSERKSAIPGIDVPSEYDTNWTQSASALQGTTLNNVRTLSVWKRSRSVATNINNDEIITSCVRGLTAICSDMGDWVYRA